MTRARSPGRVAADARQVEHREAGVLAGGEDELERGVFHLVQAEPGGFGVDDAEACAEGGPAEVGVDGDGVFVRFDEGGGDVGGDGRLAVGRAGGDDDGDAAAVGERLVADVEEGEEAAQRAVRVRQRVVAARDHGEFARACSA